MKKTHQPTKEERSNEATSLMMPSYEKLAKRNVPVHAIDNFTTFVYFAREVQKAKNRAKPPSHTLRRFPARIRKFAKEIENLLSYNLLDPGAILFPELDLRLNKSPHPFRKTSLNLIQRAKLAHQFRDLPQLMRQYADFLQGMTVIVGSYRRHPYDPLNHGLVAFAEFVHRITKSYMYAEITELANAVLSLSDDHRKLIEPDSLAKLRRNNPRLRFPIKFD